MDGKVKGLSQNHVDESELGHFFYFVGLLPPSAASIRHCPAPAAWRPPEERIKENLRPSGRRT